jgi:hypothetical protein
MERSLFSVARECRRADLFLKHRYPRKRLAFHHETQMHNFSIQPVYYPCYIATCRLNTDKLYTLISGTTGHVAGEPLPPYRRYGVAAATLTSLLTASSLETITLKSLALFGLHSFLLPYTLTSFLFKCLPSMRVMVQNTRTRVEEGWDGRAVEVYDPTDTSAWNQPAFWRLDELWDRYDAWQASMTHRAQAEDWVLHHSMGDGVASGGDEQGVQHPDPLGCYRLMGLSGREAEIQQNVRLQ